LEKTLVIVESPAKAKSIGKFLGRKYFVKASMGHLRDLPKSQFGVDPEKNFTPKYIAIRGKGDIIKDLKNAAKRADHVLLASDPDREGEAIAWHLRYLLDLNGEEKCRIEFNEITKNAIQKAVKNPRPIDSNRVNAQQARRILDRLVGYKLSPLLWKKVKKGLSAGRVQSVAVRIICDREEEIQNFTPEEYWTLTAKLAKEDGAVFEARLNKINGKKANIPDQQTIKKIMSDLKGEKYQVAKVVRREKLRRPPVPFITSSLQQEAYRKLNFTAKKTMIVAQQLYEGIELGKEGPSGLITYLRTDSVRVSETAREEAAKYIQKRYGKEFVAGNSGMAIVKAARIQDAHESIRPTLAAREPLAIKQFLTNDQYKLYKLVWERFIASQMSAAVIDTTSVEIKAGTYIFRATGSTVKFPGFMKVYAGMVDDQREEDNTELPELVEGELLEQKALTPKQHFTDPPSRYTDASLIKMLEEKGIGRPSTYAPIVETIQRRGYVVKEKKQFYPTELGIVVVNILKEYFKDIIDIEFTAAMEDKLDGVEEGDLEWSGVLREFYLPFKATLEKAEEEIGHIDVQVADEVTDELCENCSRNLVIKMGRYGKFLACPGFPECRFTKPLLESTGVKCPQCSGELVQRRSKKGRVFYGCNRYPECDFTVWERPSQEKCPVCGGLTVYKNSRGKDVKCVSPDCPSHERHRKYGKADKESQAEIDAGLN